jgi:hypothetical protein
MRQMRLYKSSRIMLLSYLVSQLYTVIFNPCFATDTGRYSTRGTSGFSIEPGSNSDSEVSN